MLILALLITSTTALIDCSLEDSCFGEPINCDPDTNCHTLFHFDPNENLHLFLRNFTDPIGYAAFVVDHLPDGNLEYFICLPNQGQRFRGVGELGGVLRIAERNLPGSTHTISDQFFHCIFSEVPPNFIAEQYFFVTRGTFSEPLFIYEGAQLYNLERLEDYDEDGLEVDGIEKIGGSEEEELDRESRNLDDGEEKDQKITLAPFEANEITRQEKMENKNIEANFYDKMDSSRRSFSLFLPFFVIIFIFFR